MGTARVQVIQDERVLIDAAQWVENVAAYVEMQRQCFDGEIVVLVDGEVAA